MEITREGENLGIGHMNYSIINTLASFPGLGWKRDGNTSKGSSDVWNRSFCTENHIKLEGWVTVV